MDVVRQPKPNTLLVCHGCFKDGTIFKATVKPASNIATPPLGSPRERGLPPSPGETGGRRPARDDCSRLIGGGCAARSAVAKVRFVEPLRICNPILVLKRGMEVRDHCRVLRPAGAPKPLKQAPVVDVHKPFLLIPRGQAEPEPKAAARCEDDHAPVLLAEVVVDLKQRQRAEQRHEPRCTGSGNDPLPLIRAYECGGMSKDDGIPNRHSTPALITPLLPRSASVRRAAAQRLGRSAEGNPERSSGARQPATSCWAAGRDHAADSRFSRMILGWRAAIRRSAIAGPSG